MSKTTLYKKLEIELLPYLKVMKQASLTIQDKEVSKYPIMVAHQHEIQLGIPLVTIKTFPAGNWNIHASSLEEFVAKNLIKTDRIQNFKATYKDTEHFACVFSLSELGAEFLFIPYVKESDQDSE